MNIKKHTLALLLTLFLGTLYAGTPAFMSNSLDIVDEGQVCYPLQSMIIGMKDELSKHCSASHELLKTFDGNAKTANAICQNCFLRPAGKERWEIEDCYAPIRAQLMPYFAHLRMTQAVYPERTEYDVILINGSTVPVMRIYLGFLQELWTQFGVRAKKIVLLTGQRKLDPVQDSEALLFDEAQAGVPFRKDWKRPDDDLQYEGDAFRMLWDQMILDDSLHNTELVLIDAPQVWDAKHNTYKRPSTIDTVNAWLETHPKPGTFLSISGNPFIQYQDATIRIALEKAGLFDDGASLESVGPTRPGMASTAIYLDNIARWLYTVYQYKSSQ